MSPTPARFILWPQSGWCRSVEFYRVVGYLYRDNRNCVEAVAGGLLLPMLHASVERGEAATLLM